jgi:hypothetical protein
VTTSAPSPDAQQAAVAARAEVAAAQAKRRKGLALWLSLAAMATVSFNMTRVGGFTISDLLFLASAAVVIAKLIMDDERYLTPRRYRSSSQLALAGIVLVVSGATLSSFGSWAPIASMMVIVRLAWSTLIWFWILRSVCPHREALFALLTAWRVTILTSSVIALLGAYAGVRFNPEDFGDGRQPGLTFHPGELMNFLITGFFLYLIPVFLPFKPSTRRFATAWWALGAGVVLLAIFTTGSTSGILAIAVAIPVVLATTVYAGRSGLNRRRTPLVPMAMIAVAFIGLGVLFTSDLAISERLTGYGDGSSNLDESIATRSKDNEAIMADFDRYLFIGAGPTFFGGGGESLVSDSASGDSEYGNIHNMWLKMLHESGFPALLGLWTILYAVGRQALRLTVATRGTDLYPVSLMLLGAFVAANTSSMFGPVTYARHFWLPLALIGCLWTVRRRELHEAAAHRREAARAGAAPRRALPAPQTPA